MIKLRTLTEEGITAFKTWLQNWNGLPLPSSLSNSTVFTDDSYDLTIDPDLQFPSRFDFGVYLNDQFRSMDSLELLEQRNDGLWAWIAVIYFKQLAPNKPSRYEHYVVDRSGGKGGLAYRHAVRTSYQLVNVHAEKAKVCLSVPMNTWGDMAEQMTARQTFAMHAGFMDTAYRLYYEGGKLRRGSSSRAKAAHKRKPGDRKGLGGAGRLALALQRLDLTYDTEVMDSAGIIPVLPKEFNKWTKPHGMVTQQETANQVA
jgi:hypothetical protein